ncbi:DUF4192 family protein [Paenarthrobacter sp. NPDC057981]|uniref:DUF4192 family protein n=1 Tax=Paenarthrobacter sp. NPDC057981 TaxID=3346297 RepID=UPI0036DC1087
MLTTIGHINWWQGRGSKAHQYLQLALDTDPGYRFARLSDQMLGAGIVAGWNTNRDTAFKPTSTCHDPRRVPLRGRRLVFIGRNRVPFLDLSRLQVGYRIVLRRPASE